MKNSLKITASSLLLSASVFSFAADEQANSEQANLTLFSDCGIGAALFPDSRVGAVSSNIIWDAGTTATSTFISTPESCVNRSAKVAVLVNDTYDNIVEETAYGSGKHLTAMMDIMECDSDIRDNLVSKVRNDLSIQITNSNYDIKSKSEQAEDLYKSIIVNVNNNFSNQCNLS